MAGSKEVTMLFSVMILISGIIGVIAVFLAWVDIEFGFGFEYTVSGWEFIRETIDDPALGGIGDDYMKWMPLITLVFSAIAAISGIALLAKPNKKGGAAGIVSGIIVIAAVVLFLTYSEMGISLMDYAGTGTYIALVAGMLMIVFGALRSSSLAE